MNLGDYYCINIGCFSTGTKFTKLNSRILRSSSVEAFVYFLCEQLIVFFSNSSPSDNEFRVLFIYMTMLNGWRIFSNKDLVFFFLDFCVLLWAPAILKS